MQIRHLAYFKHLAETRNMTAAAEDLFISQSQLSRIVSDIEREIGVPLFDRDKHGMELNGAGRVFLRYVEQILKLYEEGGIRTRDAHDRNCIHFTFGTNMDFMVQGMVERVAERIPEARFHQTTTSSGRLLKMVKAGEIGSMITPKLVEEPRMHSDVLARDRVLLVYPPDNALAGEDVVPISALSTERRVCFTPGYGLRDVLEDYYANAALRSDGIVVETTGAHAMVEYVSHGMGVALLPRSYVLRDGYCRAHCAELEHGINFDIVATWSFDLMLRPLDMTFHDILEEYFSEYVRV